MPYTEELAKQLDEHFPEMAEMIRRRIDEREAQRKFDRWFWSVVAALLALAIFIAWLTK